MRTEGWHALGLKIALMAVLAGGLALSTQNAASAVGCPTGPPVAGSSLSGVTATSSANAWAAGSHYNGKAEQTLAEHWNGKAWRTVTSADPGGSGNPASLAGVAATSPTNAWAVGQYCNGSAFKILIEHWNGKAWKQIASPSPGSFPRLSAVAATSLTRAWAAGSYENKSTQETLIEHWNGKAWKQVASPSPMASSRGGAALFGVAATSTINAWAVGDYYNPITQKSLTLILHWNGHAWKQVASPSPGTVGLDSLFGVAATSATNAWAVGDYYNGKAYQALILRWNGKAWKQVTAPDPGGSSHGNSLSGVAATSMANAWAAGIYVNSAGGSVTLILRWNGQAWKQIASPNLGPSFPGDVLSGVAVTSSANAWTVGSYCASRTCPARKTLTERWNGKAWNHMASP